MTPSPPSQNIKSGGNSNSNSNSSSDQTIKITLSCHCHRFKHTLRIPQSSFPLESTICHCSTCRHVTGFQFGTFAVVPLPYSEKPTTDGLNGYKTSEGLTRWFCGRCGASCWLDDRMSAEERGWRWEVPTGIVEGVWEVDDKGGEREREGGIEGLLDRVSIWIGDTKDGGMAVWLKGGDAESRQTMDRRMEGRHSQSVDDEKLRDMLDKSRRAIQQDADNPAGKDQEKVLPAWCHCRTVDFTIASRPDSLGEGGRQKKWDATLDACTSCRTVSGFEITSWLYTDEDSIRHPNGDRFDLHADTLGRYKTSPTVLRVFCKTCGATVFAQTAPGKVDIGIGLLDAEEGVRAESWVNWHPPGRDLVIHIDDNIDKSLAYGLREGLLKDSR